MSRETYGKTATASTQIALDAKLHFPTELQLSHFRARSWISPELGEGGTLRLM